MFGTLLTNTLLREVPAHLRGLDYALYGSVIKSKVSGQIVGHLQETSLFSRIISVSPSIPGTGTILEVVGQGIGIVQNEQIKAGIEQLKSMQLVDTAISSAGLGVSVAGFAILSAKIDGLMQQVEAQGEKLSLIANDLKFLKHDKIGDDFARLRSTVKLLEEAWSLENPTAQLQHVGHEAMLLLEQFDRRITSMLNENADVEMVSPFLEGFAMAHTARVHSRMAIGEDLAARIAADEGAHSLVKFGDALQLGAAVLARMASSGHLAGSEAWPKHLDDEAAKTRSLISTARAREANAISICFTLEELSQQHISGRAWLETARNETNVPLLFMAASG